MSDRPATADDEDSIELLLTSGEPPSALGSLAESVIRAGNPTEIRDLRHRLGSALGSETGRILEREDFERFETAATLLDALAHAAATVPVGAVLASYGGKPQAALEHLAAAPEGLLQRDLEQLLATDPTYTSKVVSRLAERSLVLRRAEGRSRRVVITAAGRIALGLGAHPVGSELTGGSAHEKFDLVQTRHTAARQRAGPYQVAGNRLAQCWSLHLSEIAA